MEGQIPCGARLVERALCDEFSVSRGVVREALAKLHAKCLVDIVAGAGATVAFLTEDKIRNVCVFREAVEAAAAAQSAHRMNREQTQSLLKCAALFDEEYDRSCHGDGEGLRRLDDRFHRLIIDGSQNEFLRNGWELTHPFLFRDMHRRPGEALQPETRLGNVAEHMEIAQAIASGNAESARALMSSHIRSSGEVLIKRMQYLVQRTEASPLLTQPSP